jgi:hypothetical protein
MPEIAPAEILVARTVEVVAFDRKVVAPIFEVVPFAHNAVAHPLGTSLLGLNAGAHSHQAQAFDIGPVPSAGWATRVESSAVAIRLQAVANAPPEAPMLSHEIAI